MTWTKKGTASLCFAVVPPFAFCCNRPETAVETHIQVCQGRDHQAHFLPFKKLVPNVFLQGVAHNFQNRDLARRQDRRFDALPTAAKQEMYDRLAARGAYLDLVEQSSTARSTTNWTRPRAYTGLFQPAWLRALLRLLAGR
jgi:hypothetical protein